jgi:hypothetical protein
MQDNNLPTISSCSCDSLTVVYFGCINLRTKLFTGTVPANKNYVTGTVPANKSYVTGTVLKKNYIAKDSRVVQTPRYNNFVQSFRESTWAANIVELYLGLLYHSTTGLSWLNIRFF